ncbi:MAG: hypothetical protein AB7G37_08400 [Solirubrobacteraceae bacterium]
MPAPRPDPVPVAVRAILGRAGALYRQGLGLLLPLALAFSLLDAILQSAAGEDDALLTGALAVSIVTFMLLQAVVVQFVRETDEGRQPTDAGPLVRAVLPVLGTALGATVLSGLGAIVGLICLVVPGLVLLTWWLVVVPVVVVERRPIVESLGRSRELVRGHGWTVFVVLLVQLALIVGTALVVGLLTVEAGETVWSIGYVVTSTLVTPLAALIVAVAYVALRDAEQADAAAAPDTETTDEDEPRDGDRLTFG